MKTLYTVAEVKLLIPHLSKPAIYAAIEKGELPGFRVGKRFFVPKNLLDEKLGLKVGEAAIDGR